MDIKSILKDAKVTEAIGATVAGTTTITATVDMQNFDKVAFLISIGTAGTGNVAKAGGGAVSDGSDASDYKGSNVPINGANKDIYLEIINPPHRYVTISVLRGTSTTINSVQCIRHNARTINIDNSLSGTAAVKVVVDPILGTA